MIPIEIQYLYIHYLKGDKGLDEWYQSIDEDLWPIVFEMKTFRKIYEAKK